MKLFKKINPNYLPLALALYFFFVLNPTFLKSLLNIVVNELSGNHLGFIISLPIVFICLLTILFSLILWPISNRIVVPLLLVVSAAISYAMFNYHVIFDQVMLQNIIETNSAEAKSYISPYSLLWISLLGIVPAAYILLSGFKPVKWSRLLINKVITITICSIISGSFVGLYYKTYASVGRNHQGLEKEIIPTDQIYNGVKYVKTHYFSAPIPYRAIGQDAIQHSTKAESKPTLLVFLLGETARAENFQYQGYDRPTNQYTSKDNVVYFKNIHSCGTATTVSVPCLFSQLKKDDYSEPMARSQDNLIDVLKHAGIKMTWLDNDEGDKGVAKNITYQKTDVIQDKTDCTSEVCYDSVLLTAFKQTKLQKTQNQVLFFHLNGSHGPTYYLRYPEEHKNFTPDCPRSDIENCTQQQLINTYDNTILYTDYIIDGFIQSLKQLQNNYNVALIYISDHGESLGENGLYLHGTPYALAPEYQTHVPLIFWGSDSFISDKGINKECLEKNASSNQYSHDNIFSSVLGIMDISTKAYDSKLDLFYQCRKKAG